MRLSVFAATLVLAAAVGHPVLAGAHGVGSREMDPGTARAMEFLYADGEPMAFAQVQVTAPGGAGVVHQSARADARGRFAFVPAGPGVWIVAASDGQGHRAVREVTVTADTPAAPGASGQGPRTSALAAPVAAGQIGPGWRDIVLGLSLLANLGLGAACLRRRGR